MTATTDRASKRDATAPASGRVRLAQLARDAALRVPGVASTVSGPAGLFLTSGGDQRVDGVRCIAASDGAYEVSLRLRCQLVPLPELGEEVRASVARLAIAAGIALTEINVLIADVVSPTET